jgi:drug/metabolite transporter (DMT)-like permease
MIPLPQNRALRAGLLMVFAMGSFVGNDTTIKLVGTSLPTGELIAIRGVMSLVILAIVCAWQGVLGDVKLIGNRMVAGRATFDMISTIAFVTALMHMQIANLTAVMQAVPLAVVLLSMVFLGEKAGPARMGAIVLGFVGVLMIVKPSVSSFNFYEMLALLIVFAVAIRDLLTKRINARVPTFVVALANAAFVTIGGLALCAYQGAQWPELWQWALLALASCFLSAGYLLMVATLRLGDLSATAPFRYSVMVFAIASGVFVFGEFPDWIATLGMALIVVTGLYAAHREAKAAEPAVLSDSARRPAR